MLRDIILLLKKDPMDPENKSEMIPCLYIYVKYIYVPVYGNYHNNQFSILNKSDSGRQI